MRCLFLLPLLIVPALVPAEAAAEESMTVMTFNVRYLNPHDGPNVWENRRDHVADIIRSRTPAVAGLQEAVRQQIDDLAAALPEYRWFGEGRDADGGGEGCPIFYHPEQVELLASDTFWLSETPEVPGSRGWDAAIQRIATWGKFRHKATDVVFYHYNVHFDHIGELARTESARLVLERMESEIGDGPAVLTGDFNSTPDSLACALLTGATAAGESIFSLQDVFQACGENPGGTYIGFDVNRPSGPRIDYIFVSEGIRVKSCEVVVSIREGRYPSDHLPLAASLEFSAQSD